MDDTMRQENTPAADLSVLRLADFGAVPDSGNDSTPALSRAIDAAARVEGPVRLVCEPGRYEFYEEHAVRKRYWITNTTSEQENSDITKKIGIHLRGLSNVTLDGCGALFVFHSKMTMLAVDHCDGITIRDISFDYERPTVAEMTIERIGDGFMDIRTHPSSRYEIAAGRLTWMGPGWRFRSGPMQAYDPSRNRTWRIETNWVEEAAFAEELEASLVRLRYEGSPELELQEGWVLQTRDGIRDQVGVFLNRSRNVSFERVNLHFMHGLGVTGQFCEHLSFDEVAISPRPGTGRTAAAFADGIHLSGCRGIIRITNSRLEGLHDDGINVHGTYLQVVEQPGSRELLVRFMHPQTYGFEAFAAGDELEFVQSRSLAACGTGIVERAELVSPREMLLTLREDVPDRIEAGMAVENVTWTPEVTIAGNIFARIPTRGILTTTRRRTLIENNVFEGTVASAVLVSCDAGSWYESGRVNDLTIRGNRFEACGAADQPVILLLPEIEEVNEQRPVHSGIVIESNFFELSEGLALHALSIGSLIFRGNELQLPPSVAQNRDSGDSLTEPSIEDFVSLKACVDSIVVNHKAHGPK
ncbi:glycoside hydrolase family 55 protein [Paenibacillus pasadenensis]|uniref:glycoside hydrolase family 55 protein n=1 Tax=Paenibacillus pasadenensis TaxID=217090 RepID=UPI00203DC1B7|nr:glycoside hydrolase family 55 protein [Paenibacillus pasadenensis]MCM3746471.1 glycoside hydrolase family 55 protein [Paenibacillus pasadenensis]